jgi:hypothetical protein
MAIRNVIKLPNGRYAYVHFENEYDNYLILGNKDFVTKEEAESYSKGFAPNSFEFQSEYFVEISILESEIKSLDKQIQFLNNIKLTKIKKHNDLSGNTIHA